MYLKKITRVHPLHFLCFLLSVLPFLCFYYLVLPFFIFFICAESSFLFEQLSEQRLLKLQSCKGMTVVKRMYGDSSICIGTGEGE